MNNIFFLTKKSKYSNKKVEVCGKIFDSKLENKIYTEIHLLADVEDVKLHPKLPIVYNGKKICTVIPDFIVFSKKGDFFLADAKADVTETAVSNLKFKLVAAFYDGARVFKLPKAWIGFIETIKRKQKHTNKKLEEIYHLDEDV